MVFLAAFALRLRDFALRRSEGNVAVMVCLGAFALLGCVGAAIDYARLSREQTLMSAAADAAALAAVASARTADESGTANTKTIEANAVAAGLRAWRVNLAGSELTGQKDPRISVRSDDGSWNATVTFDAQAATSFMNVLGVDTMRLYGQSKASGGGEEKIANDYWDLHLVVDNSSSMGLGATPADMAGMQSRFNCSFACHMPPNPFSATSMLGVTPAVARAAGYRLRIDIVADAVDSVIDDIKNWSSANKVQAQLWALNTGLVSLVDKTRKLGDLKDAGIDIVVQSVSIGDTDYHAVMTALEQEVGSSGSGKSAVDPRKAVFIITDGLHDSPEATPNAVSIWNGNHHIGTMDPAQCQALKDRGVKIGVLHIDYYTPSGYEYVTDPVINDVKPRLMDCASDGLFYSATTPDGITAALTDMIGMAVAGKGKGAVRLTN